MIEREIFFCLHSSDLSVDLNIKEFTFVKRYILLILSTGFTAGILVQY